MLCITDTWDSCLSLKKVNASGILFSINFHHGRVGMCTPVCAHVWGKLSQLFSLSIISPSLHNGFSSALNGRGCKLQSTANSTAFYLVHWALDLWLHETMGGIIDYEANFQVLLVEIRGPRCSRAPYSEAFCVTALGNPSIFLWDVSKLLTKPNLNYAKK